MGESQSQLRDGRGVLNLKPAEPSDIFFLGFVTFFSIYLIMEFSQGEYDDVIAGEYEWQINWVDFIWYGLGFLLYRVIKRLDKRYELRRRHQ